MSQYVYFVSLGLILGTVVLVFGMRSLAAVLQARARLANEDAYRRLAESTAASLARMQQALDELSPRVLSVEKMLKDVG